MNFNFNVDHLRFTLLIKSPSVSSWCTQICCGCHLISFRVIRLNVLPEICKPLLLRYFNFEPSFKLRWCRVRDLFGLQIPVTTGGFEARISSIQSSYLTQCAIWPSGLGHYFVCKRFAVQTLKL